MGLLILLGVLPYLRAFRGEFLFDDPIIFTEGAPGWSAPTLKHFNSNPRAMVHLLDRFLFYWFRSNATGMDFTGTVVTQAAWPWHVLSLLFHVGTTLCVWSLAGLFLEPWRALLAAAIFAVHPLQVSAVAYISGRAGVQAAFFSALGLLHAAAGGWHWLAVLVAQYFAYKSKPDGLLYLVFYPLILW